jgi:hypothetical protein
MGSTVDLRCYWVLAVAIPMDGAPPPPSPVVPQYMPRLLPLLPSLWAPSMEATLVHAPVDAKTDADGPLALIDELKTMLTKM